MSKIGKLSYDSLHTVCYDFLGSVVDPRSSNWSISLMDMFKSAIALFQFKYPSLLAFENGRTKQEEGNLKRMFTIRKIPSDTAMRQTLDEISPEQIQGLFPQLLNEVSLSGKLEPFKVLGKYLLCPMDGVEFFSSTQIKCEHCQQKHLNDKDKTICYSHAMLCAVIVKPGTSEVLPLDCEAINKQDGALKNDHELVAARRLWSRLWEKHPDWKFLHSGDALFANGPMIRAILERGHAFILNVKPNSHELLFAHFNDPRNKYAYQRYDFSEKDEKWSICCCNNLPLNGSSGDIRVNFMILHLTRKDGSTTTFSWVTNIKITKQNVLTLARCGRARWKIENETFNTLKNQGYQFEHNYGHGKKNLSNLLATLMMIVFLIDQIQQLSNKVFKKILLAVKSRTKLWELFRGAFRFLEINSFKQLMAILDASNSKSRL